MPLLISPIDGSPMKQIQRFGIEIDVCPTSGGVWLDKGELEKLLMLVKEVAEEEARKFAKKEQRFFSEEIEREEDREERDWRRESSHTRQERDHDRGHERRGHRGRHGSREGAMEERKAHRGEGGSFGRYGDDFSSGRRGKPKKEGALARLMDLFDF